MDKTKYLPVIQQKQSIALERQASRVTPHEMKNSTNGSPIVQSASRLHLNYGHDLDNGTLAADSFYALYEVVTLAAFSIVQFLNMLGSAIDQELDFSVLVEQKNRTLSNLLYNKQFPDRYLHCNRDVILCIKNRST